MKEFRISLYPDEINDLLNSPGCREEHFPPGYLEDCPDAQHDVTDTFENGGFSVISSGMGWLFTSIGMNVYEVHTVITLAKRGVASLVYMKRCLDTAFTQTNAMEVIVRCPDVVPETKEFAKMLGMQYMYTAKKMWGRGDMDVYSISLSQWASKCNSYKKLGQWMHEEFERNGDLNEDHEDDRSHFNYAGIAIEMAQRGKPTKGAYLYNIWASMCGYDLVSIRCEDPVVMRTAVREGKEKILTGYSDYIIKKDQLEKIQWVPVQ